MIYKYSFDITYAIESIQTPNLEMRLKNSYSETNPSLSSSTRLIISSRSSSVKSRQSYLTALLRSFMLINPVF